MAPFDRREYVGTAPETTLASDITSGSSAITVASGTGYPTGAVGPFYIVIDPGLAGEEKIRCSARTGNAITADERGADGTTASAHSAGAKIRHVFTATDAAEANQHYADPTLDHHTNYLTTARHAAVSHTAAMLATDSVTTAKIQDDAVTAAKIGAGQVGTSEIATSGVGTDEIAADAVTNAKIADDQIDSEHYVDGSIDTAHIADLQVTTGKLAASAVTTAKITDANVTAAKLATDSVTTAKIVDANVTTAKLADEAVSHAKLLEGVAWTPLQVGADGSSQPTGLTTITGMTLTIPNLGYDIEFFGFLQVGVTPVTDSDLTNLWECSIDAAGTPQGIFRIPILIDGQSMAAIMPLTTHPSGSSCTIRGRMQRVAGAQASLTVSGSGTRSFLQVFYRRAA